MTQADSPSEVNRLIVEAATGLRRLTGDELRRVLTHVAQAGFDPAPTARAGGRLAGLIWRGRTLRGSDRLTSAEVHYLRHVVARAEWPRDTTFDGYLASIRATIPDQRNGVLISKYQAAWQLTVLCRSGDLRGPDGFDWILVDYRVGLGHWVTVFQPARGLLELQSPRRSDVRWWRRPR